MREGSDEDALGQHVAAHRRVEGVAGCAGFDRERRIECEDPNVVTVFLHSGRARPRVSLSLEIVGSGDATRGREIAAFGERENVGSNIERKPMGEESAGRIRVFGDNREAPCLLGGGAPRKLRRPIRAVAAAVDGEWDRCLETIDWSR